jgi:hypothetical protein
MKATIKLILELMDDGEEAAVVDVVELVKDEVGCSDNVVYSAIQALVAVELLDSIRVGCALYIVANNRES